MKRYVVAFVLLCSGAWSAPVGAQSRKVDVCHASGTGTYDEINISRNALPAHLAHGDALPGDPVPAMSGYEFNEDCELVQAQPNFVAFYIRNNNTTIVEPWDDDMNITENAAGDGFSAITPRSGQKVGYGTSFFDTLAVNTIETVNWTKLSGQVGLVSYLNIWVTNGTEYAIIASENDYRGTVFATRPEWKVFEYDATSSLSWLCNTGPATRVSQYLYCNGAPATLADVPSNVVILSPNMAPAPSYVGTGAPRAGYGFNLIFGDTQSNFIGAPYALNQLSIRIGGIDYYPVD